jgi:DNA-binding LacI/PurR family transcriptional regulator
MVVRDRQAKVGLRDIAQKAEVSVSTVSHVLNGTAPISAEVRKRVWDTAKQLGYIERRLKLSRSSLSTVLLAVPGNAAAETEVNLVTWNVLDALRKDCDRRSIRLVIHVGESARLDGAAVIEQARRDEVDGVLVVNDDRGALLRTLSAASIPTVLINGEDPDMSLDSVMAENRFAARRGAEWLLGLGHRRIMHLTWPGRTTIRRRRDGFRDAFLLAGLPPPDDLIVEAESYEPVYAEAAIERWLDAPGELADVTAIFCAADNLALGTLRALARHGVAVPERISVLGFDDIVLGELSQPPLSTIHIPMHMLGPEALHLLERRVVGSAATSSSGPASPPPAGNSPAGDGTLAYFRPVLAIPAVM